MFKFRLDTGTLLKIVRESLSGLGTTCRLHQPLAANSRALPASGPESEEEHKAVTKVAGRCNCRQHGTHGGGRRESCSRVSARAATHCSLCSSSGSPTAGTGSALPVWFLGAEFCANACGSGSRAAAWGVAPWHPDLLRTGRGRRADKAACRADKATNRPSEAEGPSPMLYRVLFIVRKHQTSQPRLRAGELCRVRGARETAPKPCLCMHEIPIVGAGSAVLYSFSFVWSERIHAHPARSLQEISGLRDDPYNHWRSQDAPLRRLLV